MVGLSSRRNKNQSVVYGALVFKQRLTVQGDVALSHLLPLFRNKHDLSINKKFLIGPNRNLILNNLKFGFRAEWAPVIPPVNSSPHNFFKGELAVTKARARFKQEIQKGRMLGGVGWSLKRVEKFLKQKVHVIPCGAVPKKNDPCGRVIHNYSYPNKHSNSINSVLTNTSVEYITFKERVALLAHVDWFLKVDLKNGYRQLPVHPSDWHTQIYSLGPNEFYIDIAMPFGKANSARVFCLWTSAWCESFKFHFHNRRPFAIALAVYMDDFFGGPIRTGSLVKDFRHAQKMFEDLIETGKITNTLMNVKKCFKPARSMDILGMIFDSKKKACFLSETKAKKYKLRLVAIRKTGAATSKELQKLVGYLVYAAWVMPFGRPFISQISNIINVEKIHKNVRLDSAALAPCDVWLLLFRRKSRVIIRLHFGKITSTEKRMVHRRI